MKTANIILDERKYQLERLSEKKLKLHYKGRAFQETTSWDVDFMRKTKMVEDIRLWLKDELDIDGNQYSIDGEEYEKA